MRHIKQLIMAMMLLSGAFTNLFAQGVWTRQLSGTTSTKLNSVTWGGNQLVAVGQRGTILTSPNGVAWTTITSGISDSLSSVTWTGNQLVAVGPRGNIFASLDGMIWTAPNSGTSATLYSVTWTGSQLVAVGFSANSGVILTSPDGMTWTSRTSGTPYGLNSVAWTGSQLVAVGASGTILTSPDGVNWIGSTSGTGSGFNSVAWAGPSAGSGAGQLVAVGNSGVIRTSPDGVTWTARTSGTTSALYSVAWTGSLLVSVGASGSIFTSPNAVTWTAQASGATNLLTSVTRAGTQLVAVGSAGTILTSPVDVTPNAPTLLTPSQNAAGIPVSTSLTWNASSGAANYRVQLSTDSSFATSLINDSAVTTTSRATGTLAYNAVYYWRVNAKNTAGTSDYSAIWRFTSTVLSPPLAPTLTGPSQNATGVSVTSNLTWSASSTATSYRVEVSSNSGFSSFVLNDSTVTTTSKAMSGLANNTAYYWRVNAKNAAGAGAYSAIWNFTTSVLVIPAFPVLSTPAQNATGVSTSPNLSWNTASGATSYRLQVSTNSGFTTNLVDDSSITTTTRAIGPLTINTVYYWRVNAKNAAGTSAYSAIWNFTTSTVGISQNEISLHRLNLENGNSLRFDLPRKERVVIQLFNSQGRRVSQLLGETRNAGYYTMPLTSEPPGSYYLDFHAGDFHRTMKIER